MVKRECASPPRPDEEKRTRMEPHLMMKQEPRWEKNDESSQLEADEKWLRQIAEMCGTQLIQDDLIVRFARVSPLFVSADKSTTVNPYRTILDQLVGWNMIPPGCEKGYGSSDFPGHVSSLSCILIPSIEKFATITDPMKTQWKRAEIMDIGLRFWRRPTSIAPVHFPLAGSMEGSTEQVCRKLVERLAWESKSDMLIERNEKGCVRIQFLAYPPELVGSSEFVGMDVAFKTFVFGLCEVGLLPPWFELIYLLKKDSIWRKEISHAVVLYVVNRLRCDYLQQFAGRFVSSSSPLGEQRSRLREYFQHKWNKAVVRVDNRITCKYSLSFNVEHTDGSAVWPAGAPPIRDPRVENREKMSASPSYSSSTSEKKSAGVQPSQPAVLTPAPVFSQLPPPPKRFALCPIAQGPPKVPKEKKNVRLAKEHVMNVKQEPQEVKEILDEGNMCPEEEDTSRLCVESFCDAAGWTLVIERSPCGDVLSLSVDGISALLVGGSASPAAGLSAYADMMHRLRHSQILPHYLYDKFVETDKHPARQLRALLSIIGDLIERFNVNAKMKWRRQIARVSLHFWRIPHVIRPVSMTMVDIVKWGKLSRNDGCIELDKIGSYLGRFLLPRMAIRANTRLIEGRNTRGDTLLWFRSISHHRLGVTTGRDECAYEALFLLLRSCGVHSIGGSGNSLSFKFKNWPPNEQMFVGDLKKAGAALASMESEEEAADMTGELRQVQAGGGSGRGGGIRGRGAVTRGRGRGH